MRRIAVLLLAVVAAGCAGAAAPSATPNPSPSPSAPSAPSPSPHPSITPTAPSDEPQGLDGRQFLSTSVMQGDEEIQLVVDTRIQVTFEDGRVGINAGCNTMSGEYTLEDDTLVVGQMAMTEMGCDPPRMEQDEWVASFFGDQPTVALDGDELVLTVGDTSITLLDREVAIPDLELVGPTWTVDSIFSGDAVSSVPMGVVATLVFHDDGTVEVSPGCNSGSGDYTVDDEGSITFSSIALTRMACQGPAMQMESTVLAVLEADGLTYSIDALNLQLMAGTEGLGLVGTEG